MAFPLVFPAFGFRISVFGLKIGIGPAFAVVLGVFSAAPPIPILQDAAKPSYPTTGRLEDVAVCVLEVSVYYNPPKSCFSAKFFGLGIAIGIEIEFLKTAIPNPDPEIPIGRANGLVSRDCLHFLLRPTAALGYPWAGTVLIFPWR